jgi:8-oxo-dGTP pyrophosphatase MutT (NUDIX family)
MQYPNWFACYADDFFARHLSHLAGVPGLRFLQIGAFTGDASVWLLENILTGADSVLVDVDTWEGSDEPEHEPFDWDDVEAAYTLATLDAAVAGRCVQVKSDSFDYLQRCHIDAPRFDFIYVDGDHTAVGVLSDAVRAFGLLKPGGILAFDDYQWQPYPDAPAHLAPGMAIDTFTACYQDRLDILEAGLQVWVKKR